MLALLVLIVAKLVAMADDILEIIAEVIPLFPVPLLVPPLVSMPAFAINSAI